MGRRKLEERVKYLEDNPSGGAFTGDMDDIPNGTTYVKTENNYTDADVSKLSGIASGAEVNVNADWNSVSGDSQILNKPTIPTALSDLTDDATHRLVTDTERSTWSGKQDAGAYATGTGTANGTNTGDNAVNTLYNNLLSIIQTPKTVSSDVSITANYSAIVTGKYLVNSGIKLKINTGATLRIL